jgi:quercetin dioxygenase-like cupin family protein
VTNAFIETSQTAWEEVAPGVRRQILGHGPDLMMVRVDFDRGSVGALHHHPHRQVTYVVAGSFDATVDGVTRRLSAGDCFFVTADLVHGVVAIEAGTLIDVFTPTRQDFLDKLQSPLPRPGSPSR